MKKQSLLFLSVMSLIGLVSCGPKADFRVGICQLVQHDALDAATKGFQDALQAKMDEAGKTIEFDFQNASGETVTCTSILNKFVTKRYDLIMANATPALQAADSATESIPILGTSITEYGVALGIDNFNGVTGVNISGTSDLANLKDQAKLVKEFIPTAKNVGIIYCSSEANSKYQADQVEKFLKEDRLTVTISKFADSNELTSVLNGLVSKIDCLYVPTDNVCASNATLIDSVCRQKKIPVICGEESCCKKCGIATISISYYNIGIKTGEMAAEILLEGKDIKTMEIQYDESPVKKFNKVICDDLGINVPSGFEEIK